MRSLAKIVLIGSLWSCPILAQDAIRTSFKDLRSEHSDELSRVVITGEMEDFVVNTSTPHKIGKEKMELFKYTDINRVLKQSAGVYIREEDGQGLRPNIGLRGTNPDRSKKIVFMEDGVLIGPAPYSAPAAYYTPSLLHTESMEVYKGFTAVPYGPNSIGGTLNYLSQSIPGQPSTQMEASAGAFNTQLYKLSNGGRFGNFGYNVFAGRNSSDGFKQLDGGGDIGFVKNDIQTKMRWSSGKNAVELRLGYEDEDSNETYLGLSALDINSTPYRRYASSALDEMTWQHTKAHLEHVYQWSPESQIKSTMYRHDFERLWFRADSFRGSQAPNFFNTINNPANNQQYFNILAGVDDSASALNGSGDIVILGNQRTFYSQGAQTRWNAQYEWGETRHDIEVGLRLHQDQIKRNHTRNLFQMSAGALTPTGDPVAMNAINRNSATALTAHVVENLSWGNWVFTALGRAEKVDYRFQDALNGGDIERSNSVFAPGTAVLYKLTDLWSVKGSVNRGVSVAGLNDNGSEAQERSINYEVGMKFISADADSQAEMVVFYNDYSNITGTCTASTGCAANQLDQQFNGGQAAIRGLEARLSQRFRIQKLQIPVQLNATLLNAEFRNNFNSSTAEWGVGAVRSGDPLPYVPQIQYTFTAGTEYKKFKQEFAFIYQGESLDQSAAEGRRSIAAYGIVDWAGRYQVDKHSQIFARVDNLLSRDYLVSLRPFGARPGKPQSFMVGFSYVF